MIKENYLPADFNEGDEYSVTKNTNEKGSETNSASFKNLESGLMAFAAVAQRRAAQAIEAGSKLGKEIAKRVGTAVVGRFVGRHVVPGVGLVWTMTLQNT